MVLSGCIGSNIPEWRAGGPFNSWVSEGGGPGHVTALANQRPPRPLSPTDTRFLRVKWDFANGDGN